jgi:hypothetical protein
MSSTGKAATCHRTSGENGAPPFKTASFPLYLSESAKNLSRSGCDFPRSTHAFWKSTLDLSQLKCAFPKIACALPHVMRDFREIAGVQSKIAGTATSSDRGQACIPTLMMPVGLVLNGH